jgi:hypothetical protein
MNLTSYLRGILISTVAMFLTVGTEVCITKSAFALAPTNIPISSPVYVYIDNLVSMGLITSNPGDMPYNTINANRLIQEAITNIEAQEKVGSAWTSSFFRFIPPRSLDLKSLETAKELIRKARELIPREDDTEKTAAENKAESRRFLSSTNIPLASPIYIYLEKLAGMGLITSDIKGLKPYSKAEAARLTLEAARHISQGDRDDIPPLAMQLVTRIRELLPREIFLKENPHDKATTIDLNPVASMRQRYVYLDGIPRDFFRPGAISPQSAFGGIGGSLTNSGVLYVSGTEGTPLSENNNGVNYDSKSSGEVRWAAEGYASDVASALVEPVFFLSNQTSQVHLNRGYLKLGGGGVELEAGRDENWFGPGYRGALTLSGNARNFDQIKLSSPEPLDVKWVKNWLGDVKYALVFSRFETTDAGTPLERQPYFVGLKLALKPYNWLEYGFNLVRQEGGPGFSGKTSIKDYIFGGGDTNHSNSIAGIDTRFRIPYLRNTELYGEFIGEDSAGFWPVDESYVAGVYMPCLLSSCRDDLRFEFFLGSPRLYTDGKFPRGYTYHSMSPGHSQGGGSSREFSLRYNHIFSVRNMAALEYFYSQRGWVGRVPVDENGMYAPINGTMQAMELRNAGRVTWNLPVHGDIDGKLLYGLEKVVNTNLIEGAKQTNQLFIFELSYRY